MYAFPSSGVSVRHGLFALTATHALASQAVTIPNIPLSVQQSVKPMVMLAPDKEHRIMSRWLNPGFGLRVNAPKINDVAGTPQYFVEYLGNDFPCTPRDIDSPRNCSNYRITARSNPGPRCASIMLQSVFLAN